MGDVIRFPTAIGSGRDLGDETGLTAAEIKRLESNLRFQARYA